MQITGITTFYNTPDLMSVSIGTLKRHYPDLPLIIYDNSDVKEHQDLLSAYCQHFDETFVIRPNKNMGHGPGLNRCMDFVETEFVFVFDSDWKTLQKGMFEAMLSKFPKDAYGIGMVMKTDRAGHNSSAPDAIDYLHPRACLIRKEMYEKYKKFSSGGAPFGNTMADLYDHAVKVIDFPIGQFGFHLSGATRARYGIPSSYVGE